jgi:hypothetical protein
MELHLARWATNDADPGPEALPFYLVETVLFFGLALAATTRRRWLCVALASCAAVVWLLSGSLVIGILV